MSTITLMLEKKQGMEVSKDCEELKGKRAKNSIHGSMRKSTRESLQMAKGMIMMVRVKVES